MTTTTSSDSKAETTTRERILDAALEVFASKGFHDTRLDEIVTESGTSKGAIYFHFPNKERLFIALVDKFAALLEARIIQSIEAEQQGIARVRAAIGACLHTFGRYRTPAKILLVQAAGLGSVFEAKRREVQNRFARLIQQYLDEAVALGEIAPTDTQIVAYAWMGSIYELVIRWIYDGQPNPDRILDTLVPLLLRSVGVEAAQP